MLHVLNIKQGEEIMLENKIDEERKRKEQGEDFFSEPMQYQSRKENAELIMHDTYVQEKRNVPINAVCDVLIAGAGTAGIIAALAAANTGAQVILVEQSGHLGGLLIDGVSALHSYYNCYQPFPEAEKKQLAKGIPQEMIERLMEEGGSYGHVELDSGGNIDAMATLVDRECCKYVFGEMLKEAGVKVLLYTSIVEVVKEENKVLGVITENKAGREVILSKNIVDCSGDGVVAAMAGECFMDDSVTGAVSMPFGMGNVDLKRLEQWAREQEIMTTTAHIDKGDGQNTLIRIWLELSKMDEFKDLMVLPYSLNKHSDNMEERATMFGPLCVAFHENSLNYINSSIIIGVDALNPIELTEANRLLHRMVWKFAKRLKACVPGFEKAYINWTPEYVGVRRTRLFQCEYNLSLDEIKNCARFEDEIAVYGYMDMAPSIYIKDGGYYGIPYRCLVPKHIDNVLLAGRMITTDFKAHMSTRNTVSCMLQGHAAGVAAALAVKNDTLVRNVDVKEVREKLLEQGAYLGE